MLDPVLTSATTALRPAPEQRASSGRASPSIDDARSAIACIHDRDTVMVAGFLSCPDVLVDALVDHGARELTLVANDLGLEGEGVGKLVARGLVRKAIVSYVGMDAAVQRLVASGALEVELVPEGTLAERVRAGGHGLGGVLVPTAVGTEVARGKSLQRIGGRTYLLELPLRADVALLHASTADRAGNLFHRGSTRNWNPLMAMAADRVIVAAEAIVPVGAIPPELVHTPGMLVDVLVLSRDT